MRHADLLKSEHNISVQVKLYSNTILYNFFCFICFVVYDLVTFFSGQNETKQQQQQTKVGKHIERNTNTVRRKKKSKSARQSGIIDICLIRKIALLTDTVVNLSDSRLNKRHENLKPK